MDRLSPNYRNDQLSPLPPEPTQYLDKNFLHKLPNFHAINPKLVVVFSGGNGIGKSTLAKKIGRELQGLVLENDAVKACLMQYNPKLDGDECNILTWQYTMNLYDRLPRLTPNGLVVRDGVIDWYYDRILPVFKKHAYELFIIGYDISRSKQLELIRRRGDKDTVDVDRLIELLDDHAIHHARFMAAYTPDVRLTDDNLFDHDSVVACLKSRLTALT